MLSTYGAECWRAYDVYFRVRTGVIDTNDRRTI